MGKIRLKLQWDELKSLRAEIGLGMFIVSYVIFDSHLVLMLRFMTCGIHFDRYLRFSSVFYVLIGYVLIGCVLAGMVLYVSDRKGFLNRRSGDKETAVLLAVLGLALIVINLGLVAFLLSFSWSRTVLLSSMGWSRSVSRSWTWEDSMIWVSSLAVLGLVFLFGWLLLFDGLGARFDIWDRTLPSKQGIDFEEAWKKYPQDLLDKYVKQYPHNPEGVLEWHIHKKMKEGKTREQAIEELMHAMLD